MDFTLSALNLPLYLLTAWLTANRGLTDKVKYRLPLALRMEVPAIRRFWIYDLLFSTLALPFAMLASHTASYSLFASSHDGGAAGTAWLAVYPPLFILMGFLWPTLSTVSVGIGPTRVTVSIADLRDRFLGGPMIQTINNDLDRTISDYLDRLIAAIRANPMQFAAYVRRRFGSVCADPEHPTEEQLATLSTAILEQAAKDFEAIFAEFGELENIPFRDRDKPLMRVPRMTSQEEQWLYEVGIVTLGALLSTKRSPTPQILPDRFQLLRNGALGLRRARYKLAVGLVVVLVSMAGAGSVFARVTQGPLPQQAGHAKAPLMGAANPYQ
jgi:hypothetical protein